MARDKDRTKTAVARAIELCPRALGHSAAVILKVYPKWMKGATEKDADVLAEREGFEPSIRV
jgi:hypothetical protein